MNTDMRHRINYFATTNCMRRENSRSIFESFHQTAPFTGQTDQMLEIIFFLIQFAVPKLTDFSSIVIEKYLKVL